MQNLRLGLKRWRRSVPEVLITLFVALILALAPLATLAAQELVKASLSDNWRGSYDLLVLAPDSPLVQTLDDATLIDPNFAALSSPAITSEQVGQVADLEAVELAAPIGFLGKVDAPREYPTLQLPVSYLYENPVSILSAQLSYRIDDGVAPRYSAGTTIYWRIDARGWNGEPEYKEQGDTTLRVDFDGLRGLSWDVDDDVFSLFLPVPPTATTTVTAIDPVAEAQLLGEAAPDTLERLTAFEDAVRPLLTDEGNYITPLDQLDVYDSRLQEIAQRFPTFFETSAGRTHYGRTSGVFTPVLTATGVYPPMLVSGEVSQIEVEDAGADSWLPQATAAEQTPLFEIDRDISGDIAPFGESSYPFSAPGVQPKHLHGLPGGVSGTGISVLSLHQATEPTTDRTERPSNIIDSASLPRVAAQGYRRSIAFNTLETIIDGTAAGQTSTYRNDVPSSDLEIQNVTTGPGTAAPFVVGTFDPAVITQEAADSSAPLGAYDPTRAIRVSDGLGNPIEPQELAPNLTGLGLVAQPATVLTTLDGARHMGVAEPVTAIRVRVSGINDYSDESVARLQGVIRQVEGLGLNAYMVAGASQQDTRVWVDSYAFGVPEERQFQEVAPLGAVDLQFTALGVAGELVAELASLSDGLSGAALFTTLGALLALTLVRRSSRQAEMALLATQGVGRGGRLTYLLSEALPTLTVLVVGAGATVLAQGFTAMGQLTALSCLLTAGLLVAVLSATALGSRTGSLVFSPIVNRLVSFFPLGALMPLVLALLALLVTSSAVRIPATVRALDSTVLGRAVLGQTLPVFIAFLVLAVLAAVALVSASWSAQLPALTASARLLWEQGLDPVALRTRALWQWGRLVGASALFTALGWIILGALGTWQGAPNWTLVAALGLTLVLGLPLALLYLRQVAGLMRPAGSNQK